MYLIALCWVWNSWPDVFRHRPVTLREILQDRSAWLCRSVYLHDCLSSSKKKKDDSSTWAAQYFITPLSYRECTVSGGNWTHEKVSGCTRQPKPGKMDFDILLFCRDSHRRRMQMYWNRFWGIPDSVAESSQSSFEVVIYATSDTN